jgi:hypothetical protein
MSDLLSRRAVIATGLVAATGAGGALLANRMNLLPPDYGGSILGVGRTLTYASHRLLTAGQPLAREFARTEISRVAQLMATRRKPMPIAAGRRTVSPAGA